MPAQLDTPPAIWAAFVRQARWKTIVLIAQFVLIALLLLAVVALAARPPDVVLVEPDGKSTYVAASVQTRELARWVADQKQAPSDVTVVRYVRETIVLFLGANSTTIAATWPEALDRMAPPLRTRAAKQAEADKLVETTQAARIKTEIAVNDIAVLERSREFIHVRAVVSRAKSSLFSDVKTLDQVSNDLVLHILPRTHKHPDGLEVADWTPKALPQQAQPSPTPTP